MMRLVLLSHEIYFNVLLQQTVIIENYGQRLNISPECNSQEMSWGFSPLFAVFLVRIMDWSFVNVVKIGVICSDHIPNWELGGSKKFSFVPSKFQMNIIP